MINYHLSDLKKYVLIFFLFFFYLPSSCQENVIVKPAFEMLSEYQKIRDFTMAKDGNEAYFTIQSPLEEISVIVRIEKADNIWSGPELVRFSGIYRDLEPFLSPDDLKLLFASNRPVNPNHDKPKDFDIWYVERSSRDSEWGVPVNLGAPVNSNHHEFYPAITRTMNLYMTSDRPGSKGQDDIFFCKWNKDGYDEPLSMGEAINTEGYEFNAYVSPDESFLIFSGYNREDGFGSGDLYISYNPGDQQWSEAKNLGPDINSKYMDYCPFIDPDEWILYFTSRRSKLENNGHIKNIRDLGEILNTYENGQSRIYKVKLDGIIPRSIE